MSCIKRRGSHRPSKSARNRRGIQNPTGARGRVVRRVAENAELSAREFRPAFVLVEYFGYLRRNPDDAPNTAISADTISG